MDGDLQQEIKRAEQPQEMAQLENVLSNCLEELTRRGVESLNNSQLVSLTARIPPLMKSLGKNSKQEEEDDLDKIWKDLQRQEEQQLEQENAEGES